MYHGFTLPSTNMKPEKGSYKNYGPSEKGLDSFPYPPISPICFKINVFHFLFHYPLTLNPEPYSTRIFGRPEFWLRQLIGGHLVLLASRLEISPRGHMDRVAKADICQNIASAAEPSTSWHSSSTALFPPAIAKSSHGRVNRSTRSPGLRARRAHAEICWGFGAILLQYRVPTAESILLSLQRKHTQSHKKTGLQTNNTKTQRLAAHCNIPSRTKDKPYWGFVGKKEIYYIGTILPYSLLSTSKSWVRRFNLH